MRDSNNDDDDDDGDSSFNQNQIMTALSQHGDDDRNAGDRSDFSSSYSSGTSGQQSISENSEDNNTERSMSSGGWDDDGDDYSEEENSDSNSSCSSQDEGWSDEHGEGSQDESYSSRSSSYYDDDSERARSDSSYYSEGKSDFDDLSSYYSDRLREPSVAEPSRSTHSSRQRLQHISEENEESFTHSKLNDIMEDDDHYPSSSSESSNSPSIPRPPSFSDTEGSSWHSSEHRVSSTKSLMSTEVAASKYLLSTNDNDNSFGAESGHDGSSTSSPPIVNSDHEEDEESHTTSEKSYSHDESETGSGDESRSSQHDDSRGGESSLLSPGERKKPNEKEGIKGDNDNISSGSEYDYDDGDNSASNSESQYSAESSQEGSASERSHSSRGDAFSSHGTSSRSNSDQYSGSSVRSGEESHTDDGAEKSYDDDYDDYDESAPGDSENSTRSRSSGGDEEHSSASSNSRISDGSNSKGNDSRDEFPAVDAKKRQPATLHEFAGATNHDFDNDSNDDSPAEANEFGFPEFPPEGTREASDSPSPQSPSPDGSFDDNDDDFFGSFSGRGGSSKHSVTASNRGEGNFDRFPSQPKGKTYLSDTRLELYTSSVPNDFAMNAVSPSNPKRGDDSKVTGDDDFFCYDFPKSMHTTTAKTLDDIFSGDNTSLSSQGLSKISSFSSGRSKQSVDSSATPDSAASFLYSSTKPKGTDTESVVSKTSKDSKDSSLRSQSGPVSISEFLPPRPQRRSSMGSGIVSHSTRFSTDPSITLNDVFNQSSSSMPVSSPETRTKMERQKTNDSKEQKRDATMLTFSDVFDASVSSAASQSGKQSKSSSSTSAHITDQHRKSIPFAPSPQRKSAKEPELESFIGNESKNSRELLKSEHSIVQGNSQDDNVSRLSSVQSESSKGPQSKRQSYKVPFVVSEASTMASLNVVSPTGTSIVAPNIASAGSEDLRREVSMKDVFGSPGTNRAPTEEINASRSTGEGSAESSTHDASVGKLLLSEKSNSESVQHRASISVDSVATSGARKTQKMDSPLKAPNKTKENPSVQSSPHRPTSRSSGQGSVSSFRSSHHSSVAYTANSAIDPIEVATGGDAFGSFSSMRSSFRYSTRSSEPSSETTNRSDSSVVNEGNKAFEKIPLSNPKGDVTNEGRTIESISSNKTSGENIDKSESSSDVDNLLVLAEELSKGSIEVASITSLITKQLGDNPRESPEALTLSNEESLSKHSDKGSSFAASSSNPDHSRSLSEREQASSRGSQRSYSGHSVDEVASKGSRSDASSKSRSSSRNSFSSRRSDRSRTVAKSSRRPNEDDFGEVSKSSRDSRGSSRTESSRRVSSSNDTRTDDSSKRVGLGSSRSGSSRGATRSSSFSLQSSKRASSSKSQSSRYSESKASSVSPSSRRSTSPHSSKHIDRSSSKSLRPRISSRGASTSSRSKSSVSSRTSISRPHGSSSKPVSSRVMHRSSSESSSRRPRVPSSGDSRSSRNANSASSSRSSLKSRTSSSKSKSSKRLPGSYYKSPSNDSQSQFTSSVGSSSTGTSTFDRPPAKKRQLEEDLSHSSDSRGFGSSSRSSFGDPKAAAPDALSMASPSQTRFGFGDGSSTSVGSGSTESKPPSKLSFGFDESSTSNSSERIVNSGNSSFGSHDKSSRMSSSNDESPRSSTQISRSRRQLSVVNAGSSEEEPTTRSSARERGSMKSISTSGSSSSSTSFSSSKDESTLKLPPTKVFHRSREANEPSSPSSVSDSLLSSSHRKRSFRDSSRSKTSVNPVPVADEKQHAQSEFSSTAFLRDRAWAYSRRSPSLSILKEVGVSVSNAKERVYETIDHKGYLHGVDAAYMKLLELRPRLKLLFSKAEWRHCHVLMLYSRLFQVETAAANLVQPDEFQIALPKDIQIFEPLAAVLHSIGIVDDPELGIEYIPVAKPLRRNRKYQPHDPEDVTEFLEWTQYDWNSSWRDVETKREERRKEAQENGIKLPEKSFPTNHSKLLDWENIALEKWLGWDDNLWFSYKQATNILSRKAVFVSFPFAASSTTTNLFGTYSWLIPRCPSSSDDDKGKLQYYCRLPKASLGTEVWMIALLFNLSVLPAERTNAWYHKTTVTSDSSKLLDQFLEGGFN